MINIRPLITIYLPPIKYPSLVLCYTRALTDFSWVSFVDWVSLFLLRWFASDFPQNLQYWRKLPFINQPLWKKVCQLNWSAHLSRSFLKLIWDRRREPRTKKRDVWKYILKENNSLCIFQISFYGPYSKSGLKHCFVITRIN